MSNRMTQIAAATLLAAASTGVHAAVVTPYANDFDTGDVSDFTETVALDQDANKGTSASGSWSLQADGGGQAYQAHFSVSTGVTSGSSALSASLDVSAPVGDWTLATDFAIDSVWFTNTKGNLSNLGGSYVRVGIAALGTDANLDTASRYGLYYDIKHAPGYSGPNGLATLYLVELGGDGQVSAVSAASLTVSTSASYTMSLAAAYSGGSVTLIGTLSDGTNTITVNGTDTTPLTGSNFGLLTKARCDNGAGGNNVGADIDFDNVQLTAVPEPTACALLAMGLIFVSKRRHR